MSDSLLSWFSLASCFKHAEVGSEDVPNLAPSWSVQSGASCTALSRAHAAHCLRRRASGTPICEGPSGGTTAVLAALTFKSF
jgi:hypothetical protein